MPISMKVLLVVLAVLVGWIGMAIGARSDEILPRGLGHPKGGEVHWYESGCCSVADCEPVEAGAISEGKDGYEVRYLTSRGFIATGIIPYGSSAVRPSRDARQHACSNPSRVICIYLPFAV